MLTWMENLPLHTYDVREPGPPTSDEAEHCDIAAEQEHVSCNEMPWFRKTNPTSRSVGSYFMRDVRLVIGNELTVKENQDEPAPTPGGLSANTQIQKLRERVGRCDLTASVRISSTSSRDTRAAFEGSIFLCIAWVTSA
ncbi:hypothetical protein HPB47_010776 [Ixodes persulcatus]|uniref:Uncharacterized protein n=1 Tax=Ixodes persulcatus TaxID=34615 RepID=A0AC60NY64_IXOPE|nr:hypothetical protein HPB47_010776 [Ixodes persulcatus]